MQRFLPTFNIGVRLMLFDWLFCLDLSPFFWRVGWWLDREANGVTFSLGPLHFGILW